MIWSFLAGTSFLLLAGCSEQEPIVTYEVPTAVPVQLLPGKDRMLAAMVPYQDSAWFFKVTGPEDAIKEIESTFRDFVTEITFEDGSPDLRELPEGWRRGGNRPMRYASLDVTTEDKQLDVSISSLPSRDDWDAYVLDNVNRWRKQLGLKPSTEKWALAEPIDIAVATGQSIWVDITGEPGGGGPMMAAPNQTPQAMAAAADRASQAPVGAPAAVSQTPVKRMTADRGNLEFDRPEGWRDGRASSMRWASFNAGPEDAAADISMMPAGGDLRGNVARWLGQVWETTPPAEVIDQAMEAAEKRTVSDRDAQRFILTGEDPESGEIIDATIVPVGDGFSMFIKMKGPAATVSSQGDAMEQFLDSLRF